VDLIQKARQRAFQAVNTELIDLYWRVGEYISRKLEAAAWGEGVVGQLADYIGRQHPEMKGFTRASLFRMRQFYDLYQNDEKVAPLVRQLSWSHNLMILGRCKRPEEREYYVRLAIQERWGRRELERQLAGARFERVVLSPPIVSPPARQLHPLAHKVFKDIYLLEFLNLPETHSELELQQALVANLRQFLLELGADFTFVAERFRLQVGGRDFFLDLLFFHRGLNCLVVFELHDAGGTAGWCPSKRGATPARSSASMRSISSATPAPRAPVVTRSAALFKAGKALATATAIPHIRRKA
jgi:predicted nuclease of restriction endonuclease-like (RecB) superfamily